MSLPTAAMLAGLRPGYARGLLNARKLVLLARQRPAQDSRQAFRPSIMDAFRLRLLCVLMDHGLSEAAAIHTLDIAVDPRIAALSLCGIEIPPCILADRLHEAAVTVIPDAGDALPDVHSHPMGYPAPAGRPVAVTINLSAVLSDLLACLPHNAARAAISGTST